MLNYNSVIRSLDEYILQHDNKLTMFSESIPEKTVRDLLTQDEISKILSLEAQGNKGLIAMTDQSGSFKGYFPINAPVSSDLYPHRVDNEIDIFPVVCGG